MVILWKVGSIMKRYHEVGTVKEDGQVVGFFIKEGGVMDNVAPFFVPYGQFVELVKKCEIQQLYWDHTLDDIGVDFDDDCGQVSKRVQRAIDKAPGVEDFDTFIQRDVTFSCDGGNGLIPAAILYVSKVLFIDSITIAIPLSDTAREMHCTLCKVFPNYKSLFHEKAGLMSINVPKILFEELLESIDSLGYNLVYCAESARNALEKGYLNNSLPRFIQLTPEPVLAEIESIVTRYNYKSYTRAVADSQDGKAHGVNAF